MFLRGFQRVLIYKHEPSFISKTKNSTLRNATKKECINGIYERFLSLPYLQFFSLVLLMLLLIRTPFKRLSQFPSLSLSRPLFLLSLKDAIPGQ